MRLKNNFFTIIFLLIFFTGCNNLTNGNFKKIITNEDAIALFEVEVGVKPIHYVVLSNDSAQVIYGIANKNGVSGKNSLFYSDIEVVLYKLKSVTSKWQIEKQQTLFKEENKYCTFHEVFSIDTINNKPYLYFEYELSAMGNAVNYVELVFATIELENFECTKLVYGGEPIYGGDDKLDYILSDYNNLEELKNKPNIGEFLSSNALRCNINIQSNDFKGDSSSLDYYERKWLMDNPSIKEREGYLETTYYKKITFSAASTKLVRNDQYDIFSFFRGSILGKRVNDKTYFPIWVETCNHGCDKSIEFLNDSTLQITYTETSVGDTIIVNLPTMHYLIK